MDTTVEPDPDRLPGAIMEVRMHGKHVTDVDLQARFFAQLAPRRLAHVLIPFDVAAGDAPKPGVTTAAAPTQEDRRPVAQDHRHAHRRIAVGHATAAAAGQSAGAVGLALGQRSSAMSAEPWRLVIWHKVFVIQLFLTLQWAWIFWLICVAHGPSIAPLMHHRTTAIGWLTRVACGVSLALVAGSARAEAPPQRLPSALLVFPLIVVEGGGASVDTRVELVNLTSRPVDLKCIFINGSSCGGIDFHIRLTANQPFSWLASRGSFGSSFTAVPPLFSTGELKCLVETEEEPVDRHNAIQGRAAVFGADGQTIGYSAVGFLRLTDGLQGNVIELDGSTYTQCPDEQHFVFLANETGVPATESEIILAPCTEDIENVVPTTTVVQFVIVNEFEQQLSAATTVTCYARRTLRSINQAFTQATLGSQTGHIIVKGVQTSVITMLVDRFLTAGGAQGTAGNEPALRGGRFGEIRLP